MAHLWQRFLLASSLLVGFAIGVGATVFGYSNLTTVDIHWSVLHLDGVPLWAVAIVPVSVILVAGTIYHWMDGLHHFTEHMRHRHRVRDLEAEITRLREHLDHVLEMPRGDGSGSREAAIVAEAETPSLPPSQETIESAGPAVSAGNDKEPETPEPPEASKVPAPASVQDAGPVENGKKGASYRKKRSPIIMDSAPEPVHTNGAESEPAPRTKED